MLRSPRSNPMVSLCPAAISQICFRSVFVSAFWAFFAVVCFFMAGLFLHLIECAYWELNASRLETGLLIPSPFAALCPMRSRRAQGTMTAPLAAGIDSIGLHGPLFAT